MCIAFTFSGTLRGLRRGWKARDKGHREPVDVETSVRFFTMTCPMTQMPNDSQSTWGDDGARTPLDRGRRENRLRSGADAPEATLRVTEHSDVMARAWTDTASSAPFVPDSARLARVSA